MKIDRNFRVFIDFISFELEVPTICLVTGGVVTLTLPSDRSKLRTFGLRGLR
jgi:hypothetical protein